MRTADPVDLAERCCAEVAAMREAALADPTAPERWRRFHAAQLRHWLVRDPASVEAQVSAAVLDALRVDTRRDTAA